MTVPRVPWPTGAVSRAVALAALGVLVLALPPGVDGASAQGATPSDPYCPAEPSSCPADTAAPRVLVRVPPRQRLEAVVRRGLLVRVACSEACDVSSLLLLDARTARKLRLSRSDFPLVVGSGSGRSAGDSTRVRVRLTAGRVRRALMRLERVRLQLTTFGLDPARNAGADSRPILLRR